jgi:hypothetical protein
MVTLTCLQKLASRWQERLDNPNQPTAYKDALSECIYDINCLINHSIEEELSYQDYLQIEADNYLSTMEAHEEVA